MKHVPLEIFVIMFGLAAGSWSCRSRTSGGSLSGGVGEQFPATTTDELSEDCLNFIEGLPKTVIRGWVEVPEDWNRPNRRIRVFYYITNAQRLAAPNALPTILFNGGPAADSHDLFVTWSSIPQAATIPIVFMDQRGTGCSSPYPDHRTEQGLSRFAFYGSRQIVYDAEAIRTTLFGGRRWNVLATSYGSEIAHRYVIERPRGLRRVLAHGLALVADPVLYMVKRLRSQKRVAEAYLDKYPNDRLAILDLKKRIPPDRCFDYRDDKQSARICGSAVVDSFFLFLANPTDWARFHFWLTELPNALGPDAKNLEYFVNPFVFGVFVENFGLPGDLVSTISEGYSYRGLCRGAKSFLEAEGEGFASWLLNECRLVLALKVDWSATVDRFNYRDPVKLVDFARVLAKNQDVEFRLFSSELDSFSPPDDFDLEAHTVKSTNFHYEILPDTGHDGFLVERVLRWLE